jgi:hypothetical protein
VPHALTPRHLLFPILPAKLRHQRRQKFLAMGHNGSL